MMKQLTKRPLKWSWSIGVHLSVLALLLVSFNQVNSLAVPAASPKPSIEAVAIDQKQVEAQVNRLKEIDATKKREEQKRITDLERKAKNAEKERKLEQAKVEKLKKEAQEANLAKAQAEKTRLKELEAAEQLKKEQAIETEKLVKLKQEQKKIEEQKKATEQAEAQKRAKVLAEKKAKEEAEVALQEAVAREGQQLRYQSELQRYMALIQATISDHWLRPIGVDTGLKCVVEVRLSTSGEVLQAKVVRSSGNTSFDRSSEAAIRKASPLPIPTDAHLQNEFRNFNFTFNPEAL